MRAAGIIRAETVRIAVGLTTSACSPRRTGLSLIGLLVAAACNGGPAAGFSTGPGVTSASPSTSTSTGSGSSSSSGARDVSTGEADTVGNSGSSTSGVLDMGVQPDFGPGLPEGCKGKIDLLFLISRDGTMLTEQQQFLASLPGFIKTIEETFADFDTHIMVANPDGAWSGEFCEDIDQCGKNGNCGPYAMEYQCYADYMVQPCDITLGAGLLFNAGPFATNHICELYEGHRYIIQGQPNLPEAFTCIAQVGISTPFSKMGDALVAAVSDKLNGAGGCNEGFLRKDALLVVTLITDHNDGSKTSPTAWYDAVVAAKGGDPNSVVALAITPQPLVGEKYPGCTFNDLGYPLKLEDLIEMFPYHAEGDPCAATYAPFFADAASLVAEACDSYIPQ